MKLKRANTGLRLWKAADGRLWASHGGRDEPVTVRRCFPWSEPARYVSLRDGDEREFALITDPHVLDEPSRSALTESMVQAGFVLEVTRIVEVEEEVEIRRWKVETAQGTRSFQTPLDDWPREVPGGGFVVRDVAGDLYHVSDPGALDRRSRELLWAYAE